MEKVAEHINEMQRIHEEYGAIFDHLFRQHQKACKQPIDLSPGTIFNRFYLLPSLIIIIAIIITRLSNIWAINLFTSLS